MDIRVLGGAGASLTGGYRAGGSREWQMGAFRLCWICRERDVLD